MLSHIIVFENFLIENFVKKIKLSPFYLAIALYTISNIIFAVTAINNKEMVVEFYSYTVDASLMLKALFLQTFSLVFLIFLYKLYERKQKFKQLEVNGYGNLSGWILLIYQIFYILLAIFFNVGVVDQTVNNVNSNILIIVSLLSADSFFFIVGSQLKSKKLFQLNAIVYLISSILRGWMGGILIVFFVYLCRELYLRISIKSLLVSLFFAILVVLLLPFLIDLKFGIRGGEIVFDINDYFSRLETSVEYLMGRFQHVGHIYILLNKAGYYYSAYQGLGIRSFLLEGNIPYTLYNKIIGAKGVSLSEFMVKEEFGGIWNTNTGIVGWWVVLKESIVFFIMYWSFLIFVTYRLIYRFATRQLFLTIALFSIIYFYHGWLSSFFNLLFLTWLLVILKKIRL